MSLTHLSSMSCLPFTDKDNTGLPGRSSVSETTQGKDTMNPVKNLVARLVGDEEGQDLIEYALLASFVCLVAIAGAKFVGTALNNWYSVVATNVSGAAGSAS
jgi:Flp pilus assembly pilin Flp